MEDNLFDINNFNIIQDAENYYFFRALNLADNADIEERKTLSEDGAILRIRTDRERFNGDSKYKEDSGISKYTLTNLTVPTRYGGTWQRLNQNEEPINSSEEVITSNGNDYNKIKNNVFSWK